jgi:hypothetical protein
MLGDLYYFFMLTLIIFNVLFIVNINRFYKISEWVYSYKKIKGDFPEKEKFKKDEFELLSFLNLVLVYNFFMILLGIISKSWKIYLLLMSIMIINFFLMKAIESIFGKFSITNKIIHTIFMIFMTASLSFLTINHYHLHLELFDVIFNRS